MKAGTEESRLNKKEIHETPGGSNLMPGNGPESEKNDSHPSRNYSRDVTQFTRTIIRNSRKRLQILLLLFAAMMFPADASAFTIAFNCGDTLDYQGWDGILYEADREYAAGDCGAVGGYLSRNAVEVNYGGDYDPYLYSTCRRGVEGYCFDVPSGNYIVKLGFAETRFDWERQGVQDILIENVPVIEDLDVWSEVERNYAVEYRFFTSVFDNRLDVAFSADYGETFISSISIRSTIPDIAAPAVPSNVEAVGGYYMNIVSWDFHPEEDVEGFYIYRKISDSPFILLNDNPLRTSRYLDEEVVPGVEYRYRVSAVDLFQNESQPSVYSSAVAVEAGSSMIPAYDLILSGDNIEYLDTHVFDEEYVPASFLRESADSMEAGLRYLGGVSRHWHKKGRRIRFADYSPDLQAKRINLEGSREPSLIRERCALGFFRKTGLPAPSAAFRLLRVNGEFKGVYTRVEQIDEYFLETHGLNPAADLYECYGLLCSSREERDYFKLFEKDTNIDGSYRSLIELTEFIERTTGDRFRDQLADRFDVNECLTWYASQILLGNPDFIYRNYSLYFDPVEDHWKFIPRNLGRAFLGSSCRVGIGFGTRDHPHWSGAVHPFWDKILDDPQLRRRYCFVLEGLIDELFTFEETGELIVACADSVRADGRRDIRKPTFEDNGRFENGYLRMLDFARDRSDYLLAEIPDFMPPPSVNLFLNEIGILNETVIVDEAGDYDPWLEIYNDSDESVPLDGLFLTDGESDWFFPSTGSVAPRGRLLVWLDSEPEEGPYHATITPRPEGGLLKLVDPGNLFENPADRLFYGPGKADESNGRYRDAGWFFDALTEPTPGEANLWNPPVALEVSCSPDTVPLGGDLKLDILVTNLTDTTSTVELVYHCRVGIGVRRPYNADLPLLSVSVPPDDEAGFTIELELHEQLAAGRADIIVSALNGGGTTVAVSEASLIASDTPPVRLKINEFLAFNETGISDEFGEFDDWIELYNGEGSDFTLRNIFITDDLGDPGKFRLPGVTIPASGHLVVWADGDTSQGDLHCPFRLDADGEELGLFLRRGGEFELLDSRTFGEQAQDISEGRATDGAAEWTRFDFPSPGRQNGLFGVEGSSE